MCGLLTHGLLSKPWNLTVTCVFLYSSKTSWYYLQNNCAANLLTSAAFQPTMRPFLSFFGLSDVCNLLWPSLIHSFIYVSVCSCRNSLQPPTLGCAVFLCSTLRKIFNNRLWHIFIGWKNKVWQMDRHEIGPYFLFRDFKLFLKLCL